MREDLPTGGRDSKSEKALRTHRSVFGVVLRQSKPIVMGCLAIILRVPAVEIGVAAFGPVAAVSVLVFRGQQLGEIEVVLALGGGIISDVGGSVTLVGGFHDLLARSCPCPVMPRSVHSTQLTKPAMSTPSKSPWPPRAAAWGCGLAGSRHKTDAAACALPYRRVVGRGGANGQGEAS